MDGFDKSNVRCASCGRFLSFKEMIDGPAKHRFEPLNEFGPEISEWDCSHCVTKEKPNG